MKIEKLNRRPWRSVEDVRAAVFEWIESCYNRRRRHSSLGYLSPLELENQHYDRHTISKPLTRPPKRGKLTRRTRAFLRAGTCGATLSLTASAIGGAMTDGDLYTKGIEARRAFLGAEYVDASLSESDDFMMTFQRAVTELALGYAWSRPGLDTRTRAMVTLGILAALGRHDELAIYTQGAVRNGVTVDELEEILVHVTAYCGTPAGHQAFLAVHGALEEVGAISSRRSSA